MTCRVNTVQFYLWKVEYICIKILKKKNSHLSKMIEMNLGVRVMCFSYVHPIAFRLLSAIRGYPSVVIYLLHK